MNEIFKKLKQWREDRNIVQSTENDYKANMFEELSKYYRAKDVYSLIDALCDMAIFTINHAEVNNLDQDRLSRLLTIMCHPYGLNQLGDCKYLGVYRVQDIPILLSTAEAISDDIIIAGDNIEELSNKTLADIFLACWKTVYIFGYDFEKCMLETIKEISSRRQDPKQFSDWVENGASGKWLKDKNQDPDTLYKADYERCKL